MSNTYMDSKCYDCFESIDFDFNFKYLKLRVCEKDERKVVVNSGVELQGKEYVHPYSEADMVKEEETVTEPPVSPEPVP